MSKRVMQAALAALVVGFFSLQALSQPQTTTKRLCIEAMNLSALRVSSAQGKEVRICVQNGARGNLGPLPLGGQLEACFAADTANRVFRMKEKGLALEQAKCAPGLLPDYGVPTLAGAYDIGSNNYSSAASDAAIQAQIVLTRDLLGSPADGGLANQTTQPAAANCQRRLLTAAQACVKQVLKEFNRCKKTGLRTGAVTSAAGLATQCLMQQGDPALGQPDPNQVIGRRCQAKFAALLSGTCSGVPLATALPGLCGAAANVPNCMRARVNCRACQQLNHNDSLSRDCDLFDDGLDNGTCPDGQPVCGDGDVDIGLEQCDDGNNVDGDCCDAQCRHESAGSACGSSAADSCTNADTCDGLGTCLSNDAPLGTPCGSGTDDECTNPDTCDGVGGCQDNHEATGVACGDPSDGDCTDPDTCDGGGACLAHDAGAGASCGDPSDGECTDPDTCDGVGTCNSNHAGSGTGCSDDGNPCTADVCDESGACVHENLPDGSACGDPTDDDCTNPDTCEAGVCTVNHESAGAGCQSDGIECTADLCDGSGACTHSLLAAGSPCGNPADTTCTDPDTCDAAGVCQGNDAGAGTACASDGNECTDDLCNGSGTCAHPNKAAGTACTDDGSECTHDQCNGGGSCIHPAKTAGTACSSDGNPCTDDQCNGAGSCAHPNNTAPCSDGLFCNGADTCSGGNCSAHAGNPCPGPDGDGNCNESCNESTDSCTAADPNGSACNDGQSCNGGDSCSGGSCVGSGVCCGSQLFTFTVNSNSGGVFDSAEWPGGTASQNGPAGCSVTINRPNANIDLVCTLAAPFSVNSFAGYSNCFGTGGEDGDGCQPNGCPPAGIGSCCSGRPSCSAALNGSGSAKYFVQCVDP